jgi:hypothetical protein
LPLSFALLTRGRVFLSAAALLLAGEAATLSRGPWIGAALLTTVSLIALSRAHRARNVGLCVVGFTVVSQIPTIRELVDASASVATSAQSTLTYRQDLLHATVENLTWFGKPTLSYAEALPGFADATSLITTTALSSGILGLAVLSSIVALSVRAAWRGLSLHDRLLQASSFALLAQLVSLISVTLITNFQHFFWLTVALVAWRETQSGVDEEPLP